MANPNLAGLGGTRCEHEGKECKHRRPTLQPIDPLRARYGDKVELAHHKRDPGEIVLHFIKR